MATANQVAQYILSKSCPEEGHILSHLELQNILYYCQGFHLAIMDEPLFNEIILHGDSAPIVPEVYFNYTKYRVTGLPKPTGFDDSVIDQKSKEVIDEVLIVYGQFSYWKLRKMIKEETPFSQTENMDEITHIQLTNYFKTQLVS